MARSARAFWQVVIGLPEISTLNETERVGDSVQMIDSTIIRAHHCADSAKGGLRIRVLGAQEAASRQRFTSVPMAKACP
jgi:hypothetical protein